MEENKGMDGRPRAYESTEDPEKVYLPGLSSKSREAEKFTKYVNNQDGMPLPAK